MCNTYLHKAVVIELLIMTITERRRRTTKESHAYIIIYCNIYKSIIILYTYIVHILPYIISYARWEGYLHTRFRGEEIQRKYHSIMRTLILEYAISPRLKCIVLEKITYVASAAAVLPHKVILISYLCVSGTIWI